MPKQVRVARPPVRARRRSTRSGNGSLIGAGVAVFLGLAIIGNWTNGSAGASASAIAGATSTPSIRPTWSPTVPATPEPSIADPTTTPTVVADATPDPTPASTPVPTPVVVVGDVVDVSMDSRPVFRGQVGEYTWTSVYFLEDQSTLYWTVKAGSKSCRLDWLFTDVDGSNLQRTVSAKAGQVVKGSKRYDTAYFLGAMTFASTCPAWSASLRGYVPPPDPTPRPVSGGSCHPSYRDACLKKGIGDYDCASGSGNGPNYVSGPIRVVGFDEFDLDRDGDGIGCENG